MGRPDDSDKADHAGESAGGAYPNPHAGGEETDGALGHGGQSHIDYFGPDHAEDNAATGKG